MNPLDKKDNKTKMKEGGKFFQRMKKKKRFKADFHSCYYEITGSCNKTKPL